MAKAHDLLESEDQGKRSAARMLGEEGGTERVRPSSARRAGASSLLADESSVRPSSESVEAVLSGRKPTRKRASRISRLLRNEAVLAQAAGDDGESSSSAESASGDFARSVASAVRSRRSATPRTASGSVANARRGADAAKRPQGRTAGKAGQKAARARRKAILKAQIRRENAIRVASQAVEKGAAFARSAKAVAVSAAAIPSTTLPAAFAVVVVAILVAVGAVLGVASAPKSGPLDGFPPYITASMVRTALECQEEYGHPAGCTIAQIIAESGMGDHMSQLATRDHNLFGMKWSVAYEDEPEVSGFSEWTTEEEYEPGHPTQIVDRFTVFKSDEACITFRSRVFLQGSRYANNPLIKQAIAQHSSDKMAEGLKDAGWATDSSYVSKLKSIMDEWGLRALDTMTVEDWEQMLASGGKGQDYASATAAQKAVADQARIEPFVGDGWCAAWVRNVFTHCGNAPQGYLPYASSYMKWCPDRLDASRIKVGMIVVTPSSATAPGIGHIGIYIGGGIIRSDETGGMRDRTIENWLSVYSVAPSYMGWINDRDLTKE